MKKWGLIGCLGAVIFLNACTKEIESVNTAEFTGATPYRLVVPPGFPKPVIPADNPMTVEGVALGRRLFYDNLLSANNTMSCANCHLQNHAFTDPRRFSVGIDSIQGRRNSMPLFNLAWDRHFFWDGGSTNLESQAIDPIVNPIELHQPLSEMLAKLNAHPEYPALFQKAFGSSTIQTAMVVKAIAQFERSIVSADSKFDRYQRGEESLTAQEQQGLALFLDVEKGDCFHCHTMNGLFTDYEFRNTGLDMVYADEGRASITLNPNDAGKFKTPSLRNIALTAPYMHDGRFNTLMECVEHYNSGFNNHPNLDPNIATKERGRMTQAEMEAIVAFLNTLTDYSLTQNPNFSAP
jgi:cytochrome c peroxidase